jgi:FKBP-type peptidyl-prolyl cis-trans isomerase FkpA
VSKRLTLLSLLVVALVGATALSGCASQSQTPATTTEQSSQSAAEQPADAQASSAAPDLGGSKEELDATTELKIDDLVVGTGAEAKAGDTVTVNYTGWTTDGAKFDSSLDSGQPFSFALGTGYVIKGWDEGVAGMKVGGKRRLTIPADMGYGEQGAGEAIPPNSVLVFEVELLGVN